MAQGTPRDPRNRPGKSFQRTGSDKIETHDAASSSVGRHRGPNDMVETTDAVTNVTVGYGISDRPWFEKWWLVTQGLGELERAYKGEATLSETSQGKALVTRFCSECWDMKDWLVSDTTRVPKAARTAAKLWAESDDAIQLTGDVANTHKHLRRRKNQRVAGVSRVSVGPGASMAVSWKDPGQTAVAGSRDALELARTAVKQWRTFLAKYKLSTPY